MRDLFKRISIAAALGLALQFAPASATALTRARPVPPSTADSVPHTILFFQALEPVRKVALACQLAVIFEHRSGAANWAVSTGAQEIAVRWPPE